MRLTAETLYIVRKVCGCTQARLAGLIGVTESYVNKIERGKCRMTDDIERRIKRALDLDEDRLSEVLSIYERFNVERRVSERECG